MLISLLKVVGLFIVLVLASWLLAIFWSAHGDWWLKHQPEALKRALYAIVRPLLSSDVTEAEDQLAFWLFWLPSFIVTILAFTVLLFMRKFIKY